MKFDLDIAIDQQTRACDRTFEGVPGDSHAHLWSKLCPIMPNHLNMLKTKILGALLLASQSSLKFVYEFSSRFDKK